MKGNVIGNQQTLAPYQAEFVQRICIDYRPLGVYVLVAPVGTGKTFAIAEALAALAARSHVRRVLILSAGPLVEQWAQMLNDRRLTTIALTPPAYRLLRERVRADSALPEGIYAMGIDLAAREDIADHLRYTAWDLIVVDEAHRLGDRHERLLAQLRSGGEPALLLATATPTEAVLSLAKEGTLIDWGRAVAEFFASRGGEAGAPITRKVVTYRRSSEETALLRSVVEIASKLETSKGDLLLRRAGSSLSALEATLIRWSEAAELSAENRNACAALLTVLEQLEADAHLQCGLQVIRELLRKGTKHIVAFCEYADTATYVSSAMDDVAGANYLVSGSIQASERAKTLQAFRSDGGVLVCTPVDALSLSFVGAAIHYDVPGSMSAFAQREGRYRRYGRSIPCIAYLLMDTSGALPADARIAEMAQADLFAESIAGEENDLRDSLIEGQ